MSQRPANRFDSLIIPGTGGGGGGSTGPAGPTGATGPAGPTGPQGPAGTDGATGPQGLRGFTGDTGAPGTPGSTGPTGQTGLQGPPGSTGAQGTQGVQGATGAQGIQGVQGAQGIQGIQGTPGGSWMAPNPPNPDYGLFSTQNFNYGAAAIGATCLPVNLKNNDRIVLNMDGVFSTQNPGGGNMLFRFYQNVTSIGELTFATLQPGHNYYFHGEATWVYNAAQGGYMMTAFCRSWDTNWVHDLIHLPTTPIAYVAANPLMWQAIYFGGGAATPMTAQLITIGCQFRLFPGP